MAEESIAAVDQAEALLAEAKARKVAGEIAEDEYRSIKREAVAARVAWRRQEEAAGRRSGLVGGDAVRSGG